MTWPSIKILVFIVRGKGTGIPLERMMQGHYILIEMYLVESLNE